MTRFHHEKELEDLNAVGGHCPRCGAEYRPGFTTCADCDVPLVPGPAPEQRPVRDHRASEREDHGEPVVAASLPRSEAWLMAGRLRAEGIPAEVIDRTFLGPVYGGASPGFFDVIVPRTASEEAARIVEQYTGRK